MGGNVLPARHAGLSERAVFFFTVPTYPLDLDYASAFLVTPEPSVCSKVALNTAVDVYQWLREVCSARLINDEPVMLEGPVAIVQMDESLFKHKPKVV